MKIYEPNYTQVPNAVISMMPHFTEAELKVILAITRKTVGWQKKRDRISLTQLEEMTGMARASITKAIKSETFSGLIKTYSTKKGNEYELIISSSDSELPNDQVVQNLNQTSSKSELPASSKSEHTKETITKETKQKKSIYDLKIVDVLPFMEGGVPERISDPEEMANRNVLLALHIWNDVNNIRPNNQTTLNAKVKNWSDPIRLMLSEDDRTYEEIWRLWKAVRKDQFWRTNVLSTGKLREKFDDLAIKLLTRKKNGQSSDHEIQHAIDSIFGS